MALAWPGLDTRRTLSALSVVFGSDLRIRQTLSAEFVPALAQRAAETQQLEWQDQAWLELGRDFCSMARQHRVTVGNLHHHLDLLFFHRALALWWPSI